MVKKFYFLSIYRFPEKKMSNFNLSKTFLDLDPFNEVGTRAETNDFAQVRGVAAGKPRAPHKPLQQPPEGGLERWIEQASRWMKYVLSPENGQVKELITRRTQYLANMSNLKKNPHDALKAFNDVNRQLRDKFLLPPRVQQPDIRNALKNDDDVADFLRANNLMK
jgi:hypothetical protein